MRVSRVVFVRPSGHNRQRRLDDALTRGWTVVWPCNSQLRITGPARLNNWRPYAMRSYLRTLWRVSMAKGSIGHARSAKTGQYVTKATAARNPRTTVVKQAGNKGSGTHSRSAITGHFVTPATARRHPGTTVTEKG